MLVLIAVIIGGLIGSAVGALAIAGLMQLLRRFYDRRWHRTGEVCSCGSITGRFHAFDPSVAVFPLYDSIHGHPPAGVISLDAKLTEFDYEELERHLARHYHSNVPCACSWDRGYRLRAVAHAMELRKAAMHGTLPDWAEVQMLGWPPEWHTMFVTGTALECSL